jgi:hypothetical protein
MAGLEHQPYLMLLASVAAEGAAWPVVMQPGFNASSILCVVQEMAFEETMYLLERLSGLAEVQSTACQAGSA